jgi:hypothetical protein
MIIGGSGTNYSRSAWSEMCERVRAESQSEQISIQSYQINFEGSIRYKRVRRSLSVTVIGYLGITNLADNKDSKLKFV